jgi:chromosomal replication initiation ATPase DnaA
MTLVEELHQKHKERIARLNKPPAPKPPPAADAEQIANLKCEIDRLSAEVSSLKRHYAAHDDLIGRLVILEGSEKPRFTEIMQCVCEYYNVTRNDVASARRTADLVLPRQIICYLGRTLTGMSFPQMCRHLGDRDHTTALHSANKIEQQLKADEILRDDIDILKLRIAAKVMARQFGPNVKPFA